MTCRQLIEFLSDYSDGALPAQQRKLFSAHLKDCSECRQYVDQFAKTVDVTKQLNTSDEKLAALPKELVKAIVNACK